MWRARDAAEQRGFLGDVIRRIRGASDSGAQVESLVSLSISRGEQHVVGVELIERCCLAPIGLSQSLDGRDCLAGQNARWRFSIAVFPDIGAAAIAGEIECEQRGSGHQRPPSHLSHCPLVAT